MDSSRRQDSEYIILIWFDTWRPKVMLSAPSCPIIEIPSMIEEQKVEEISWEVFFYAWYFFYARYFFYVWYFSWYFLCIRRQRSG